MGLIERIKSALGLGTSASASQPRGRTSDRPSGSTDGESGGESEPASEFERDEDVESAGTVVSQSGGAAGGDGSDDQGVDVTVEHAPSTESEDAVKGTDTAETDATASTDSPSGSESATETDSAETDSAETDSAETDSAETESAAESEATEEADAEGEVETEEDAETVEDEAVSDDAAVDEPSADLEDVKGIGPTYADRLHGAGIEDVAALAEADPADLADRVDIPQARLEEMVERAGTY